MGHLEKFIKDLNSNYPIHFYKVKNFNKESNYTEARIFITNKKMCSFLYEKLKIIPNRTDATNIINHIPSNLHKFFILGLFDGDGSFSYYKKDYGEKINVTFGGSEKILRFIENHLKEHKIIVSNNFERKIFQRHKEKDGNWRTINFTGKKQGMNILNYIYNSPIYLNRKYQKYLSIPYHNK